jgi:hypothetical protein
MKFVPKPLLKKKGESNNTQNNINSPFLRINNESLLIDKLKNGLVASESSVFYPLTDYLNRVNNYNTLSYTNNNQSVPKDIIGLYSLSKFANSPNASTFKLILSSMLTLPAALITDLFYNLPDLVKVGLNSISSSIKSRFIDSNLIFKILSRALAFPLDLSSLAINLSLTLIRGVGNIISFPFYVGYFGYNRTLKSSDFFKSEMNNLKNSLSNFVVDINVSAKNEKMIDEKHDEKIYDKKDFHIPEDDLKVRVNVNPINFYKENLDHDKISINNIEEVPKSDVEETNINQIVKKHRSISSKPDK